MEPIRAQGDAKDAEEFAVLFKIPRYLVDLLDAEAKREQRNRTKQAVRILEERYGIVQAEERISA